MPFNIYIGFIGRQRGNEYKNNTLFWIKRHVTFHKTTRRFPQNNTSLFTNQSKGDGDTCDSKKCKIPVLGAHAARTLHAREGDSYTRIRQLSLIGDIGDCIAVKNTSVLQNKNSILVLQKNFSSLFCVFFTHQGNIYPYTCRGRIEKVQHFITFLLTRRKLLQHITQENLAHLSPLSRLRENLSAN